MRTVDLLFLRGGKVVDVQEVNVHLHLLSAVTPHLLHVLLNDTKKRILLTILKDYKGFISRVVLILTTLLTYYNEARERPFTSFFLNRNLTIHNNSDHTCKMSANELHLDSTSTDLNDRKAPNQSPEPALSS